MLQKKVVTAKKLMKTNGVYNCFLLFRLLIKNNKVNRTGISLNLIRSTLLL